MAHKTQGNIYLCYLSVTKDSIKDIDEPPDEEVHKVKSRNVPGAGAAALHGVTSMPLSQQVDALTHLEAHRI